MAFLSVKIVNKNTGSILAQGPSSYSICTLYRLVTQLLRFHFSGSHTKYIP